MLKKLMLLILAAVTASLHCDITQQQYDTYVAQINNAVKGTDYSKMKEDRDRINAEVNRLITEHQWYTTGKEKNPLLYKLIGKQLDISNAIRELRAADDKKTEEQAAQKVMKLKDAVIDKIVSLRKTLWEIHFKEINGKKLDRCSGMMSKLSEGYRKAIKIAYDDIQRTEGNLARINIINLDAGRMTPAEIIKLYEAATESLVNAALSFEIVRFERAGKYCGSGSLKQEYVKRINEAWDLFNEIIKQLLDKSYEEIKELAKKQSKSTSK